MGTFYIIKGKKKDFKLEMEKNKKFKILPSHPSIALKEIIKRAELYDEMHQELGIESQLSNLKMKENKLVKDAKFVYPRHGDKQKEPSLTLNAEGSDIMDETPNITMVGENGKESGRE